MIEIDRMCSHFNVFDSCGEPGSQFWIHPGNDPIPVHSYCKQHTLPSDSFDGTGWCRISKCAVNQLEQTYIKLKENLKTELNGIIQRDQEFKQK